MQVQPWKDTIFLLFYRKSYNIDKIYFKNSIMKIEVQEVNTLNEIKDYWTTEDYTKLLVEFDFPDAQNVKKENIKEMLFMAINDFETNESATILLKYKLGNQLNDGQIDSLSHEMTVDKVAEEYPEPSLHFDLFNINQFLFKAYNGKFPNTEATEIIIEVKDDDGIKVEINREILAKIVAGGLKESCLVKRLYAEQLNGEADFVDADNFIWTIENPEENKYKILTSNYWIGKNEILESFTVNIEMPDED